MLTLETKIKDINWCIYDKSDEENQLYMCNDFYDNLDEYIIGELGSITVLDRLTGFSIDVRDIETGFRDNEGEFWLASGNFDIREYPELSIAEAIALIKARANTCNPDRE